jgi:Lrp/AsnC family transcriptional regulator, regulator of ectoine-degradation genes
VTDLSTDELDGRDYQILRELQRNARIKVVDLAERINLSPSPCFSRLKRLEESGVIKGYSAILDFDKLAKPVVSYAKVTLDHHTQEQFEAFERVVNQIPEIVSCYLVSGDFDYLMKVVTRDIDHFHRITALLFSRVKTIDKHFTFITIKEVKDRTILPIDFLLDKDG